MISRRWQPPGRHFESEVDTKQALFIFFIGSGEFMGLWFSRCNAKTTSHIGYLPVRTPNLVPGGLLWI
jgi:hypothetical protein